MTKEAPGIWPGWKTKDRNKCVCAGRGQPLNRKGRVRSGAGEAEAPAGPTSLSRQRQVSFPLPPAALGVLMRHVSPSGSH